jgi:monothiol glutaredoxin
MDTELKTKIISMIKDNKVLLFMKGTKEMPQCGFSKYVVDVFSQLGIEYTTVNILENESIRSGMKEYSAWPTFPQLYVNKEFVGGCDIISEMYQSGELQELFEIQE